MNPFHFCWAKCRDGVKKKKKKKGPDKWAQWGGSATGDNSSTVIASVNDSMSTLFFWWEILCFLFSMGWSAIKNCFFRFLTNWRKYDYLITKSKQLKNSHHNEIASEWYRQPNRPIITIVMVAIADKNTHVNKSWINYNSSALVGRSRQGWSTKVAMQER